MLWSITFRIASSVMVMMREPSGLPITMKILPSLVTMVGLMEESGRLPGSMALFLPWIRPNRLGAPTLEVKSSISSLRKKPVSPAITLAPKLLLMV